MTGSPKDQQSQRRACRLSAALRDNLKRRKAQAKGRNAGGNAERAPAGKGLTAETHDSAGFAEEKKRNR